MPTMTFVEHWSAQSDGWLRVSTRAPARDRHRRAHAPEGRADGAWLVPACRAEAVLATLEQSVVFITSANIERLLHGCSFDSSAWTLANLYLAGLARSCLRKTRPALSGWRRDHLLRLAGVLR